VAETRNPANTPALCRLTRELADLGREWLNYDTTVKYTCPAFHEYTLKTTSGGSEIFAKNYELDQQMISLCVEKGL
jgi:hypothetical protein